MNTQFDHFKFQDRSFVTGGDDSMLCLWKQGVQPVGKDLSERKVCCIKQKRPSVETVDILRLTGTQ